MTAISANRLELARVARSVADEKGIDISIVNSALEAAFQKAARTKYGMESDLRAELNLESGEILLIRQFYVVDEVENPAVDISLKDARIRIPDIEIGGCIAEELPPIDLGRIAAQSAKHVIIQMVREAEREAQYEEFKDRVGQTIHGTVKRIEYGNIWVDVGTGEAIIRRVESIPNENFRTGDRVKAYLYEVRRETGGAQVFLSRTRPEFLVDLFATEVPDVANGTVEIHAVARDPGQRAKVAVKSNDTSVDPVGACIGHRGVRVQPIVNELNGERCDIIRWSEDAKTFISDILKPATVLDAEVNETTNRIDVIVTDDTLGKAIGRKGQNIRLASKLTGLGIDVFSETEASEKRQREFTERTQLFASALNVDEMVGQLLTSEGFTSVEEIAEAETGEIASIAGLNDEIAGELKTRADEHLEDMHQLNDDERKKLGVSDDLLQVDGMTVAMLVALGKDEVRTLDDFAGCSVDDLLGWNDRRGNEVIRHEGAFAGMGFSDEAAGAMIMQARELAGWMYSGDDE